jgi:hypothetical protein
MSDNEFVWKTPAFALAENAGSMPRTGSMTWTESMQFAGHSFDGASSALLFTDLALAEEYLESLDDPSRFQPVALPTDEYLEWFLAIVAKSHSHVAVDLDHKTGVARTFKVAEVLKQWREKRKKRP